MFSSSFADSLIRSGVQGGSKVMLTVTSPMPSTVSSADFTIPGISPATGQLGGERSPADLRKLGVTPTLERGPRPVVLR